jgi:hypothetical protein
MKNTEREANASPKDAALKLALEALGKIADVNAMDYEYRRWAKEAITAIKEVLAQPEQEPVAWLQFRDNEPPVVAPRNLGTPVFLGIRGGLAHDAGEKP